MLSDICGSDSSVSRSTNSNRDLGLIWIRTEECEFLVGVVFSVEYFVYE